MSLKSQAAGVNAFLELVYGPGSRPSALLEELGCMAEQVAILRTRHLEAFLDGFVRQIAERLTQYDGGERKFRVLARRLGLDGEQPATLAALGVELGVSRERIRQIEESTLRRCRFMKQRQYWLEALYSCAVELLAGEGIVLPTFDLDRAAQVIARMAASAPAPATVTSTGQEKPDTSLSADVPQQMIDHLHETVNAIFAAAGDDIADSILADLLSGSTRTVIVALVGHYNLQFAHGAFKSIERKRLKYLVREARRAVRRPAASAPQCESASIPTVDAAETEKVARLVEEIRACVGSDHGYWMYGHILHGSHGPKVDELVAIYQPPHFGRLRPLGIKRVLELVKIADTRRATADSSPAQFVASDASP